MEEYIIAPAIKKGDEVKISRFCHAELINNDGFFKGAEQGFITSFNRFVDRKEALKIAKQNNENLNKLCDSDELYSEDLFMNEHELINKNKELDEKVIILEGNKVGYKLAIEEFKKENKELLLILENKAKESHLIQSRLDEANVKIIELNKIIDEMASFIEVAELDEDIAKTYCKNEACTKVDGCRECIKEYFKKKASDENGNRNDN